MSTKFVSKKYIHIGSIDIVARGNIIIHGDRWRGINRAKKCESHFDFGFGMKGVSSKTM